MSKIWIFNHYAMAPPYGTMLRHYDFAKYLMKAGHDVTIFAASVTHNTEHNYIKDNSLYLEKLIDGRRFVFVGTSPYSDNSLSRIRNMLEFYLNLKKVVRRFPPPDIIYASSPQLLVLHAGIRVARRLGVPCVSEVRDLWPESIVEYNDISRSNPIIQALYIMEKYIYRRSDAIIFTTEGMYDYIRHKGWDDSVDESKCHYINNGVDLKVFSEEIRAFPLQDADLAREDTFKVVYCGSIRRANNIDLLVDCAAELQKRPDTAHIQFLIYGDGSYRKVLEQRSRELKLDNICFKGFVEKRHIPYVLSRSDLNVLNYRASDTQRYGSSANKLFEYLAAGHPVLANIDEGKYPIISRYRCGEVLADRSISAYADAVERFARMDTETYEEYCRNALQTAQLFDIPNLARRLEEVLNACITDRKEQR